MDAEEADGEELARLLDGIPHGWSRMSALGASWGVSRTERAGGRSTTLHAEELGGSGRVDANVWRTGGGTLLRPCEMPASRVMAFLRSAAKL